MHYPHMPAIPCYGNAVCCGVPKTKTVPIPAIHVLETPVFNPTCPMVIGLKPSRAAAAADAGLFGTYTHEAPTHREWHGFGKPVRVTGTGTKGYGCG
jgi:hypothetical protein